MSEISTLYDDVERLGGIASARYIDADKRRAFALATHMINNEVMRVMDDIDFQGEKSTHDLVADQREYPNPSDLLKIKRVDLKIDGSNWKRANFLDESQLDNNYASESDITNKFNSDDPFISLFDGSFIIYSGTISAITGGILITYDKEIVGEDASGNDITEFGADDDVPTLKQDPQQALVYSAIIDFYTEHPNEKRIKQFNKKLWGREEGRPHDDRLIGGKMRQILDYYSDKSPDAPMSFSSTHDEEDL